MECAEDNDAMANEEKGAQLASVIVIQYNRFSYEHLLHFFLK